MRGASLADIHLGFRAYPATIDGRNAREVDVERAWFDAIDGIVEYAPEIVTIAGDVFHHPRVSDYAKLAYLAGLRRLLRSTDAAIIVLQGNHDAGKTADVLTPLELAPDDRGDRLWIVTDPQRIRFETAGEEVAVAAFPYVTRGDGETYRLEPRDDADVNLLVMHAAVKGSTDGGDTLPFFYGAGDQSLDVAREADRWDVIAVGDYHEFTVLHPDALAFYSGSLERTSSNIWAETKPKGWVAWDTEAGTMELRKVEGREMDDIQFDGEPTAEALNRLLEDLAAVNDRTGWIVRLKVEEFPREEREHIDWRTVRGLKQTCLHFYLDIRYARPDIADLGDRRDRGGVVSLAEESRRFFEEDDADVREAAFSYLGVSADAEEAL